MVLSDEKATHLSHLILNHFKNPANARLKVEEVAVLREIKRFLAAELKVDAEVDVLVRRRLACYSRPLAEGSPEWETLYRKTFEEGMRKRKKRTCSSSLRRASPSVWKSGRRALGRAAMPPATKAR